MKKFFDKVKDRIKKFSFDDEISNGHGEYLELDTTRQHDKASKVVVRPFVIEDFSDIKAILDSMRGGYTVGLVNIRPLKDKDLVELKRAINKLKKTCEAVDGDIAGFGDDYLVIVPSFAEIYREKAKEEPEE
ncbi:cell division protein SepF [Candidatus Woesearchaeota archaeon]|nr:cell division protein SepF [Candidatus Woesearchaeota archaeon]